MKYVVGYVQAFVYKKNFLVQFKYRHIIYMSYVFLSYMCYREEVGQESNKTISNLIKKKHFIFDY